MIGPFAAVSRFQQLIQVLLILALVVYLGMRLGVTKQSRAASGSNAFRFTPAVYLSRYCLFTNNLPRSTHTLTTGGGAYERDGVC